MLKQTESDDCRTRAARRPDDMVYPSPQRPDDVSIGPGDDGPDDLGESVIEPDGGPPPTGPHPTSLTPPGTPPTVVRELISAIEEERRGRMLLAEEPARLEDARAQLEAECAQYADECEARVHALEDELAQAKADLAAEKEYRVVKEQEQRDNKASNRELEREASRSELDHEQAALLKGKHRGLGLIRL